MKILELFTETKEVKAHKEAQRIARTLKRNQEALLDSLEARKDKAQDTLDKLTAGDIANINTETFVQRYHDATIEIALVKQEIIVAEEIKKNLF